VGGAFAGQILVVLDQQRMLATEVVLCEDGHAQERSLLGQVLPCVEPGDLWIADRNFCTVDFLGGIAERGGCFVVRQHGQLKGILVGARRYKGAIDTGKVYEQKLGLVTAQGAPCCCAALRWPCLSRHGMGIRKSTC